jgi:hypothetical protein
MLIRVLRFWPKVDHSLTTVNCLHDSHTMEDLTFRFEISESFLVIVYVLCWARPRTDWAASLGHSQGPPHLASARSKQNDLPLKDGNRSNSHEIGFG